MVGPMADMTFDKIFEQIGAERAVIESYTCDISEVDQARVTQAYLDNQEDTYGKFALMKCQTIIKVNTVIQKFLKNLDNNFQLAVDVSMSDLMHTELKVHSDGVGNLAHLAYSAVLMKNLESFKEELIDDFG